MIARLTLVKTVEHVRMVWTVTPASVEEDSWEQIAKQVNEVLLLNILFFYWLLFFVLLLTLL